MSPKILTLITISLLLAACGGDGDGGGKRGGVPVAPDLFGARQFAVGGNHTCAVLKTGKLVCWGKAHGTAPVEVDLGGGRTALAVAAGTNHTCAIADDRSLKCWGDNTNGQLGDGDNEPQATPTDVELGEGRTPVSISLGGTHTCARLDDNSVKCWGSGAHGKLGDGNSGNHNEPVAVNLADGMKAHTVSAGRDHTCALLGDGRIICWGSNSSGQLGDGTGVDNVAPVVVSLGSDRTAKSMESGALHTCAVLDDGSLVCWGLNADGQLGDATTTDRNAPVTVNLGRTALAVTAGFKHTCALLDDNSVVCWGLNDFGQLGDQTILPKDTPIPVNTGTGTVAAIRARGNATCALFYDGSLACWGSNRHGQSGTGGSGTSIPAPQAVDTGDETVTAIDGGANHTCGLFEDSDSNVTLKCLGENEEGRLGTASNLNFLEFTDVHNPLTAEFTSFSTGWKHTCAIRNSLYCWGEGGSGQLGKGSNNDQQEPGVHVNLGSNKTAKCGQCRG